MPEKLTKFTEQELKQRKIGTFLPEGVVDEKQTQRKTKLQTYATEGVTASYNSLLKSFAVLLLDAENAKFPDFYDRRTAEKCAQIMMDTYLLRGSRGEKCEIPNQVHLYEIKKETDKEGIELYDATLFEEKGGVSENEKLRWIFENMQVAGIEPADAPSIGAYTLLMELRENKQARQKFYDSLWPKLMAKEDAEKTGKLEDTGKTTIELVDRLLEALPEETNG
jgi:hypothetical protein